MSVKNNGDNMKVRLWERQGSGNNSLLLKAAKNYDYETGYITRSAGNVYSRVPMSNGVNNGVVCDFLTVDNGFKAAGKIKNGIIQEVTELEQFPQTESQFSKLGNAAKRFCKKITNYVKNIEAVQEKNKILESVFSSKIFKKI